MLSIYTFAEQRNKASVLRQPTDTKEEYYKYVKIAGVLVDEFHAG